MVKVNFALQHVTKAQMESRGIAQLFIINVRWGVGVQCTPQPL
jgi:hypothetical protein